MQGFNEELSLPRFFAWIGMFACGLALLVLGFIFLVDPYKVWRHQATSGFNELVLETPTSAQIPLAVLKSALHKPDILILGSSRVRRGFNEAQASRLLGGRVQVIGIDLFPLDMASQLFSAVSKTSVIKRLYLEVNYFTSNSCKRLLDYPAPEDSGTAALLQLQPGAALSDSIRTLRLNLLGAYPLQSYVDARGNYHEHLGKGVDHAELRPGTLDRAFQKIIDNCQQPSANAADAKSLAQIMQAAQLQGTEVTLLFLPISPNWHARLRAAGLEQAIAEWKEDLSQQVRHWRSPILDYDQRDDLLVALPASPDTPVFWDLSHFSMPIGQRLLADMAQSYGQARPARSSDIRR